ncbi:putative transcription factor C3H family [Helianthus debilis subsp. tardiflorus]
MNAVGRHGQSQRSGASGAHHRRQYSNNFLEVTSYSSNGRWVRVGFQHFFYCLEECNCIYYLRTGMCGYGDNRNFHLPTYNWQDVRWKSSFQGVRRISSVSGVC